ncbi:MAG: metalloregulator ArsR/SmtB family transcription factor [Geothermobacteraceae bacterium]
MRSMKQLSDDIKALGDETRLRILNLLRGREVCVCDIIAALDLPQSTVSRHLAILRRAGWVLDQRRGSWMFYRLADDADSRALLDPLLTRMEGSERARADLQALGAYLDRKNGAECG